MSMAFTYEIRGSDERTPVLIVVIVSTVVMPEQSFKLSSCHHLFIIHDVIVVIVSTAVMPEESFKLSS